MDKNWGSNQSAYPSEILSLEVSFFEQFVLCCLLLSWDVLNDGKGLDQKNQMK
jgi:hypothetical protein